MRGGKSVRAGLMAGEEAFGVAMALGRRIGGRRRIARSSGKDR
jgi:hypothetical protein